MRHGGRAAAIVSALALDQMGSGFDFIRRVKADAQLRDIPFIFLSSTHWDARLRAGVRSRRPA